MLKWFDATAAEAQADKAIDDVQRLVPKEEVAAADGSHKKQVSRLGQTIDRHRQDAIAARYNVYQKAKFANRIKWGLRDKGYPDAFIDSVVRLLII